MLCGARPPSGAGSARRVAALIPPDLFYDYYVRKKSTAHLLSLKRADDVEAEQTRRARRGREQDFAEISRRMYEEIRSSRDPRDQKGTLAGDGAQPYR